MKVLKKLLCVVLVVLTIGSLCACGASSSGDSDDEMTIEEQVCEEVKNRAAFQYLGSSIGGNELKSSSATITNVKEITETEYVVSGKIVMIDIYGTQWNNTFDCEVTHNGEKWVCGSFEFTNENWSKSY